MTEISQRLNPDVSTLNTPAIPLALSWADSYSGAAGPLIDLSQAVPDYPPHPDLLAELSARSASIQSSGYGEIEGEAALRKAYVGSINTSYQCDLDYTHTHITAGCNQAFVATLMTLASAGDTVLLSNPCYFNHEATASMLGIRSEFLQTDPNNGFVPNPDDLDRILSDRTTNPIKVVALVSPNNPTGAIYPSDVLHALFEVCKKHQAWLVLDETYRDFADSASLHTLFNQTDWQKTFIQLYSFSKTFCIPGHRLGAITASPFVIQHIAKVMDNLQICAPRAAQLAVAVQLPLLKNWVHSNTADIQQRATTFRQALAGNTSWKIRSMGAYFAYVEHSYDLNGSSLMHMSRAQNKAKDRQQGTSAAVVKALCSVGVLPLPGSFFGSDQERYCRVAFANASRDKLGLLPARLDALALKLELTSSA